MGRLLFRFFARKGSSTGQFARPAYDVISGNWLNESSSDVNLYASIDEVTASDSDYIQGSDAVRIRMSPLNMPATGTATLRIRLKKV